LALFPYFSCSGNFFPHFPCLELFFSYFPLFREFLMLMRCSPVAGFPTTHRLHGGNEGAAGDQRPQGQQDRGYERKQFLYQIELAKKMIQRQT
jgi:hypothetical protein